MSYVLEYIKKVKEEEKMRRLKEFADHIFDPAKFITPLDIFLFEALAPLRIEAQIREIIIKHLKFVGISKVVINYILVHNDIIGLIDYIKNLDGKLFFRIIDIVRNNVNILDYIGAYIYPDDKEMIDMIIKKFTDNVKNDIEEMVRNLNQERISKNSHQT